MSGGFRRRRRRGDVVVTFEPLEVALLSEFLAEMVSLLEIEAGGIPDTVPDDLAELDAVETLADFEALTAEVAAPADPVLRRLLPDAYPDDAEASSDFRRFTQDALVGRKHAAARTALATLADAATDPEAPGAPDVPDVPDVPDDGVNGADRPDGEPRDGADLEAVLVDGPVEIILSTEQAQAWLGALNDIRLALGVRLGVEQDDEERWAQLADSDPRATIHEVYSWLGWLQETLVRALG